MTEVATSAPCCIKGNTTQDRDAKTEELSESGLDIFSVGVMLKAAGVDLDAESAQGSGHSVRYEGFNMVVSGGSRSGGG